MRGVPHTEIDVHSRCLTKASSLLTLSLFICSRLGIGTLFGGERNRVNILGFGITEILNVCISLRDTIVGIKWG